MGVMIGVISALTLGVIGLLIIVSMKGDGDTTPEGGSAF